MRTAKAHISAHAETINALVRLHLQLSEDQARTEIERDMHLDIAHLLGEAAERCIRADIEIEDQMSLPISLRCAPVRGMWRDMA